MSDIQKLLIGVVLGYVGYIAYRKYSASAPVQTTTDVSFTSESGILPLPGNQVPMMMAGPNDCWRGMN